REAGIRFEIPAPGELAARLDAVLEAIYAAYGSGWEDVAGADPRRHGLAEEAIWLGRLVARLRPDEPEAQGLLALMLHCEARRAARRDAAGAYVPLGLQDSRRWSRRMIEEAEEVLAGAARLKAAGRFQLEAAIQSVHAQRVRTGETDWEAVTLLYEGLLRHAPTIGARVAHAAALGEARDDEAGLAALDAIPPDEVATYQPYWALRGHMLKELSSTDEVLEAFPAAGPSRRFINILLWSPALGPKPTFRRIALAPGTVSGHTYWHMIDGWGLVNLQFGLVSESTLRPSDLRY